jgi:hypothetical protein
VKHIGKLGIVRHIARVQHDPSLRPLGQATGAVHKACPNHPSLSVFWVPAGREDGHDALNLYETNITSMFNLLICTCPLAADCTGPQRMEMK